MAVPVTAVGVVVCLVAVVVAALQLSSRDPWSGAVAESAGDATPASWPAPEAPEPAGPVWSTGPAARPVLAIPVELDVERVGLRMPVVPVGVAVDGQMALPADPGRLGWYRFGPAPSEAAGSVVLAGHVDSRQYGVGPLVRLRRVHVGDEIVVRLANGRDLRYRTTSVVSIARKSLPDLGVFDREGPVLLRVVTCGGAYDRSRGGYQDNIVVTAEPS